MWDRSKEAPVPKTTSIRSSVSVELRLVTDTDRHSAMAYTALAKRRAVKRKRKIPRLRQKVPVFFPEINLIFYNNLSSLTRSTKIQSRLWDKVREGSTLVLGEYPIFLTTQCGIGGRKPPRQKPARLVLFWCNTGLWVRDGQTDGRRDIRQQQIPR